MIGFITLLLVGLGLSSPSQGDATSSPALKRIAVGKTGSADLGDFGHGDLYLIPGTKASSASMDFQLPPGSSQGKHSRWYLTRTWAEVRLSNTNQRSSSEIAVDANDVPVSRFVIKTDGKPSDKCGGRARILWASIDYVDGDRARYTCKRRFFVRFSNYLPTTNEFLGVGVKGGANKLSYSVLARRDFVKSVRILKRSLLIVRNRGWPIITLKRFRLSKDPVAGQPFRLSYVIARNNPRTSVPARRVTSRVEPNWNSRENLSVLSQPTRVGKLDKPRLATARLVADSPGEFDFFVYAGSTTNSPSAKLKVTVSAAAK
jgi:hypothetical protein